VHNICFQLLAGELVASSIAFAIAPRRPLSAWTCSRLAGSLLYDANPERALPEAANTMPNLNFTLTGDYVELHNLLKITGLADSGGSAKMMVADGAVMVDGRVETRKTCKIRAGQVVLLGDTRIAVHEG